jgi:hypothetical protein
MENPRGVAFVPQKVVKAMTSSLRCVKRMGALEECIECEQPHQYLRNLGEDIHVGRRGSELDERSHG